MDVNYPSRLSMPEPPWATQRHVFRDITGTLNSARLFAEWAIKEKPLISLTIAFATGGLVGWLVKRL